MRCSGGVARMRHTFRNRRLKTAGATKMNAGVPKSAGFSSGGHAS